MHESHEMNARKSRLRIPRVSLENHESDEDFVEPQNSEIRGREREREKERSLGGEILHKAQNEGKTSR